MDHDWRHPATPTTSGHAGRMGSPRRSPPHRDGPVVTFCGIWTPFCDKEESVAISRASDVFFVSHGGTQSTATHVGRCVTATSHGVSIFAEQANNKPTTTNQQATSKPSSNNQQQPATTQHAKNNATATNGMPTDMPTHGETRWHDEQTFAACRTCVAAIAVERASF